MAERKHKNGASLPFAALQILAPPVRLVSAALWKVVKQRDVMQYGVLEEFVTSACETVPGLLTFRHQGKLALGLRGRLILELCHKQPDEAVITPHLGRIRAPASTAASNHRKTKDVKVHKTVENFHLLVRALLTDAAGRERFFKEEFPVDYGPAFDQELENLLWEFLIRLDQLLPVPSLAQTVSWLSDTPSVLEECARAATQPQLLKILLQHQMCMGHLETAASLPPNMGDSILASLSLPPSGRAASNEPTGAKMAAAGPSDDVRTQSGTPFIAPVIGTLSNDDVPAMISANKGAPRDDGVTGVGGKKVGNPKKRKEPDGGESDEGEQGTGRRSGGAARAPKPDSEGERDTGALRREDSKPRAPPGESPLRSVIESCLNSRPVVLLDTLPAGASGGASKSSYAKWQNQRRQRPDSARHALDNKENRAAVARTSPSLWQRSSAEAPGPSGDGEDYVADSEDEATKNFKDRLFVKRYRRTKHGTFVPTLREYFRPRVPRRDLLSPGGKPR